jgi:mannitol/fructose-specific phosphotransferase system IIA component (Ntr-type)
MLPSIDTDVAIEVVMEREKLGSTGIGQGIAIPHGRLADLSKPMLALARHKQGVEFESIDGEPVHIIILLLAPEKEDKSHLELLAHIARIMQRESVRDAIMHAESAEEISRLVEIPMPQAA